MPEKETRPRRHRSAYAVAHANGCTPSAQQALSPALTRTPILKTRPPTTGATSGGATAAPHAGVTPLAAAAGAAALAVRRWLARRDWTFWALFGIAALAFLPRIYGLNWDANNQLHPDERAIMFHAICLAFPGTPYDPSCGQVYTGPGWFFSPLSPLNTHFFAYGTFPQYLVAAVARGLAWISRVTNGHFVPPDGGAWDDFNHFTLVGRALSALFDTGSVLLAGLLARRLAGRWAGVLAAAFVAVIPFDVQVSHFYAVDTLLLFFVLLTLLACLRLVQGKAGGRASAELRERARHATEQEQDATVLADAPAPNESPGAIPPPATEVWSAWRGGLFIGVAFGLAMATKVSALPLLAPIAVALVLSARRRGLNAALLAFFGAGAAALVTFALVSPYAFIDSVNFWQQVNEQTMLSRGQLDYPYVRQFATSTPFVYQIQQLLLYDMGLPLGLLGLAGFAWAVARVWRRWSDEWAILVVFLAAYFAVVGGAYTKFTRYMLPVFALLAVCGAAALVALARWGARRLAAVRATASAPFAAAPALVSGRMARLRALVRRDPFASTPARRLTARWWRAGCIAVGAVVLAVSLLLTLALTDIYSAPNTRVQASQWMYDHIPAGKVVTYENWDRGLPVDVPAARHNSLGEALTAAGNVIDPGEYQSLALNIYDDDTPTKVADLAKSLAMADVVVLSSNHLLHSIPRLPDRYPATIRYYQLLFAGKLGFTLAAHFETHPSFLGYTENDTGADESFYLYDHPPVWIFTRSGAGLSQDQIQHLLTDGLFLPAESTRSGSQKSLLLPSANVAANAQSPALYEQTPPNSLPNQIPLVWWLLLVELLGLISFPLTFFVCRGLRDRGWGLSKLLGLLLLAYLVWLPASLHVLPFDRWVVFAAFALLALAGGALAWWRRAELLAFARSRWRLVLVGELGFLAIFLFFAWVRALDPDLWHLWNGGEKPMDFAYLNAILRSRYMPPLDPFFAGGYINYYYYGLYLVAVLIKLTGILPATAFNLAIPLLAALTFSGAFSLLAGLTRRAWAGVAGGLGLVIVSNLDGLLQVWAQVRAANTQVQTATGLVHVPIPAFDYWHSSRIIPYTINEFPFWSFLFADLHAHVIDLPIVVFIIACCASLLASARKDGRRWRFAALTLVALALALGAAWCTNTWDLPTFGILAALVLALRLLPLGRGATWAALRAPLTWRTIRGYALALTFVFGGAFALYLPFQASFYNFLPGGTGPVTTPTPPFQFFTLFGIWLFLLASFFVVELWGRLEGMLAARGLAPGTPTWRLWALALGAGLILLIAYVSSLKLLLIVLLAAGLFLALNPRHSPARLMTYLLLLLGLAIALGVELIYVRDFLDFPPWNRMNTVFKFYYQVWVLFALGGALAFTYLVRAFIGVASRAEQDTAARSNRTALAAPGARIITLLGAFGGDALALSKVALRGLWGAVFFALLLGSSIYVPEGTAARVQDPAAWAAYQPPAGGLQPQGLSLDGMAFLKGWFPGDYEAINWINAHVSGTPTIVEAGYSIYYRTLYGRVAMFTGLPAVLDPAHEDEQRFPNEVGSRQGAVEAFWGTNDPNQALSFLRQYGVQYVYLGALERTCYAQTIDPTTNQPVCVPMPAAAIAKFQTLEQDGVLQMVHRNTDVVIYKVVG